MKHWYKSKTLWFNFVTLLIVIAEAVEPFITQFDLTDAQRTQAALITALVSVIGNKVLRMVTSEGLGR